MQNSRTRYDEFLEMQAQETDDCILWPHGKNNRGYGALSVDGTPVGAHRLSCEMTHGAPIIPNAHAAHSCHTPACINPRHLRWATPAENEKDKRDRGWSQDGEANYMCKLPDADVQTVRRLRSEGVPAKDIAKQFKVSRNYVYRLSSGKVRGSL